MHVFLHSRPPEQQTIVVTGREAAYQWLAVEESSHAARSQVLAAGHKFLAGLIQASVGSSAKVEPVTMGGGRAGPERCVFLARRSAGPLRVWRVDRDLELPLQPSDAQPECGPSQLEGHFSCAFAVGKCERLDACDLTTFSEQVSKKSFNATPLTGFISHGLPGPKVVQGAKGPTSRLGVLICDSAGVRAAGWRVREDLSLEAQVVDIVAFLRKAHPWLKKVQFAVVCLRLDAILCVKIDNDTSDKANVPELRDAKLIYSHIGHDYLHRREQGLIYGSKSIIAACLASEWKPGSVLDIEMLSKVAINAASRCVNLYSRGYPDLTTNDVVDWSRRIWIRTSPLSSILMEPRDARQSVPDDVREAILKLTRDMDTEPPIAMNLDLEWIAREPITWSITRQRISVSPDAHSKELAPRPNAHNFATKIAGPKKMSESLRVLGLRILQVDKLTALDRSDVDNICSVQRMLRHYLDDMNWKTPLSIGVFGAPGSGKSFGVKELAKSFKDQFADSIQEFNIAQWTSLTDMASAFHKVRDVRLGGSIPVAFFDEFDADFEGRRFGWLKYFLMPMQDGRFQDRGGQHDVGRAVLVFAGGINHRFAEFSSRIRDRDFCDAKGPDFLSRLRCYYDVPSLSLDGDGWDLGKLRRASILRSKNYKLSPQVLHALLSVSQFRHGARSMTAILEMSNADRISGIIDRSSLPRRDQLSLHVDYEEFARLLEEFA